MGEVLQKEPVELCVSPVGAGIFALWFIGVSSALQTTWHSAGAK